jgi:glycosyltransferase involved in cell wall biosynthesis
MNDDRVLIIDWTDDMPVHYALHDLVVLPSYREGFPYVILEASAMGIPVVATRVTGCVDAVVDGVTGTLVPARDSDALERAIEMYVEDVGLCLEHGRAGRERVVRYFRQEPIWATLYADYAALMGRG